MATHWWVTALLKNVDRKWKAVQDEFRLSGYKVFYSPIRFRPGLMIIGLNPGGDLEDFDPSSTQSIPPTHEYLVKRYRLAKRMRCLFNKLGRESLLAASVKLNVIFFRTRASPTGMLSRSSYATISMNSALKKFWISLTDSSLRSFLPKGSAPMKS